ncbi:MAG: hypothetical protein IKW65_06970 [Bacteroidales bacterium]|nr:hypothetical protein [Bacteroidales bacterium]
MRKFLSLCVVALISSASIIGQNVNKVYIPERIGEVRQEIVIPNIGDYQVLKCDFHIHTVFSDGDVWPTYRVQEAWRDGLDVISITDHIEYLPHKKYVKGDFNTPYELAKPQADKYGLMLVRGTEITRKQGVIGHFNALFIEDANAIPDDDPFVAVQNARKQNAFVLFNHPGWAVDTCLVTEFQQRLFDADMIDGIEVVNHMEYYPRVVSWCIDKKLPMFANSDEHGIISEDYTTCFRPMTLVLVEENSQNGVKEALLVGRSIAYTDNKFMSTEDLLLDLFEACVDIKMIQHSDKKNVYSCTNKSSFPFVISVNGGGKKVIPPFSTIHFSASNKKNLEITILNMWCYEDEHPVLKID